MSEQKPADGNYICRKDCGKKTLALLLATVMPVGLVGCGGNHDPAAGTTNPAKATDSAAPSADDVLTFTKTPSFR